MRTITKLAVAIAVAVLGVLGASPAWAHDVVAPSRVAAGSSVSVTLGVVNEHDLPTDGVEVRVPPGFTLTSHAEVPGWKSQVVNGTDGTASAVRWTGGLLQSNETGEFVLGGTAPSTSGPIVWVVAQKSLGRGDYVAPPVSFSPQMTVTASAATSTSSGAPVPLAGAQGASTSRTVDGVARSRATLALVLAGLALVAVVFFEMTLVRRGQLAARGRDNDAGPSGGPGGGESTEPSTPAAPAAAAGPSGRPTGGKSGATGTPPAGPAATPSRKSGKRKNQQAAQPVAK